MRYAVAAKFFTQEMPWIVEAEDVKSAAQATLKELADNGEPMFNGTLLVVEHEGFDEAGFIHFVERRIQESILLNNFVDYICDYENEMAHEMAVAAAEWMKKQGRIFPDWKKAVAVTVGMQLTIEVQE